MAEYTSVLGSLGTLLILVAYIPQIRHIIEARCTAGISFITWHAWWLGSLMLLVHAYARNDAVFMAVQGVNLVAVSLTLVYAKKYEGQTCGGCRAHPTAKKP